MNPDHFAMRFAIGLRRSFAVFLATGILLFSAAGSQAQDDIYTVADIEVDATAESAAAARQAAHAEGYQLAFDKLLARMVLEDDLAGLARPTRGQLEQMVSDFSVAEERTSDVRYLATMIYRFWPEEVRRYLRQSGVSYAQTRSKPMLVLPVYESGGSSVLWEDPNPWRETWILRTPDGGLVPFTTPLGDLGDMAAVDAAQALAGDPVRLSALAERYGAGEVLVVEAVQRGDPLIDQASLEVTAKRSGIPEYVQTYSFQMDQLAGESFEDMLLRATDVLAAAVQEDWKANNLLIVGQEGIIEVSVPITSLNDWLTIKRKVASVPLVQSSRLLTLRRYEAQVSLIHLGDLTQLARAFAQQDLYFGPGVQDNVWELRLGAGSGPGTGSAIVQ